jgi:hypothetical protein
MFRKFAFVALAFTGVALVGARAQANWINVPNFSFEDATSTTTYTETIANWTKLTSGTAASYYQPGTAHGNDCLLLACPSAPEGATPNAQISQVLTDTYEAGKTYALTVAVGGDQSGTNGGAYDIALYAGSTLLASGSAADYNYTPTLSYKDVTITYNPAAPGAPIATVGDALRIQLNGIDQFSGQTWTMYDNVRLSATPEPSTLVLVLTSLIGLLAYAWRKRK